MDAEYLFYMKSIETNARAFLALIILTIGTVTHAARAVCVVAVKFRWSSLLQLTGESGKTI